MNKEHGIWLVWCMFITLCWECEFDDEHTALYFNWRQWKWENVALELEREKKKEWELNWGLSRNFSSWFFFYFDFILFNFFILYCFPLPHWWVGFRNQNQFHLTFCIYTFVNRLKCVVHSTRKHGWVPCIFTKVCCWSWAYIWHGKQDTLKFQH